jgi:hypothetical protein
MRVLVNAQAAKLVIIPEKPPAVIWSLARGIENARS